jgi:transglutaminase-like putative cysteine protease
MSRLRDLLVILATLCILGSRTQADDGPRSRRVRLTYSAEVRDMPSGTREVRLWLPFPPNNDAQEISNIVLRSDLAASVNREDEYGNQVLSLTALDPGNKPVRVELTFDVIRRERRNDAAVARKPVQTPTAGEKISERWLQRDRLVPIDGEVLALALEVTRGREDDFNEVRAIYDHTVSTLKYDKSGTGWGRGDIAYACDAKKGNCTDFHAVFIGLCRARAIPARFEIGFSLPTDKPAGEISGYHCWADCHVDGFGWIPVDCSEAQKNPAQREYFFGAHDEHRVAFSTGRDIRLNPPQRGERLNYFIYPYAEADGKPHEAVDRKVRYVNLEE